MKSPSVGEVKTYANRRKADPEVANSSSMDSSSTPIAPSTAECGVKVPNLIPKKAFSKLRNVG